MLRYRVAGLVIWFICSYDLLAGFRCFLVNLVRFVQSVQLRLISLTRNTICAFIVFFWSKLGSLSRLESTLNQRSEMFCIFLQRVTVLIGEPMEFTETVDEYRNAKKNAVSWCFTFSLEQLLTECRKTIPKLPLKFITKDTDDPLSQSNPK